MRSTARRVVFRLAALALGLAVAGLALGGCSQPGQTYACKCSFLTDFDDPSKQSVTVCAPSAERAPVVARGCAQSAAPARVDGCACVLDDPAPCEAGRCSMRSQE